MTQKPRGTERVVLLDTFRCIVCLYIKVLLEFLWIMRPRLLIIAPAIRLHYVPLTCKSMSQDVPLKKMIEQLNYTCPANLHVTVCPL